MALPSTFMWRSAAGLAAPESIPELSKLRVRDHKQQHLSLIF